MPTDKEQKRVFLTGLPISTEMEIILEQLKRKEYVSIEQIEAAPEIALARKHVAHAIPTIDIIGRDAERVNWMRNLEKMGCVSGIDTNGEPIYNGSVISNSRLDIVIGLPASGKSSNLANTISQEFHSRVIDNDEAKKQIPEYNNGWGADIVHKESKIISDSLLFKSLQSRDNIVLPKVGSDYNKMLSIIRHAQSLKYKVYVHYFELDRNLALGRMINRFIEQGRFLDPKLIDKYCNSIDGNKIEKTYNILKKEGILDGYSKWSNDVKRGEKPILLETNCRGQFITTARVLSSQDRNNRRSRPEGSVGISGYGRTSGKMEKAIGRRTDGTDKKDLYKSNITERSSILEKLKKNKLLQTEHKQPIRDIQRKSDKTL